jgi:hypothetical protein
MNDMELMGQRTLTSMNDVEIMGADIASLLDSLGAHDHAKAVHHAVSHMKATKAIDPNAVAVIQRAYKSVAYMPLSIPQRLFDPAVPASLTQTILVTTSRPMKPHELIIPSTLAPFFDFNATVAGVAQNSGADNLPAENYSSGAFRSTIRWSTINTSTPLTMTVVMTDVTVKRTFKGMLQGPTLLT